MPSSNVDCTGRTRATTRCMAGKYPTAPATTRPGRSCTPRPDRGTCPPATPAARCSSSTRRVRSPAALGEPVRLRELLDVDADHGLAQAAGDLREDVRVVVERRRLD